MAISDVDVAIIGGGAAGIAAARRLRDAGLRCLIVEARSRLGGRAFTAADPSGFAIDLGCGWLHSADRNPWSDIAKAQSYVIDKTPPPWARQSLTFGFSAAEQRDYRKASHGFYQRLGRAEQHSDRPASALLEPGNRWNDLIVAVNTFVAGAELPDVSAHDLARYDDSGVDWRVTDGYGTLVTSYAADIPVAFSTPVHRIDHSGLRIRIETATGVVSADQAIIAVPTSILSDDKFFKPALPEKAEAALSLPLGLDDKLFLSLDHAEEFEKDSRMFGRIDRTGTGAYHFRPFGRPHIECYFGGTLAHELETNGEAAFFDFASSELAGLLGNDFAKRITPIRVHRWGVDPFARGSYSYARPGQADQREVLARPVNDRLFFAGEACSRGDYSTAHGAYLTGVAAAEQVLAIRR
ncbi:flavin monoamine oxidase family protein [Rhodoplanes sp. Z2-YC6860]|uniref:flavin monoamine oxidase family protein n=1 Tax=Rhodoplanes sp. Z2-YC6860 TaxID=674703 RepID=UPI00078B2F85|nr:NAD(P)/FAD-dependent oxidoreductase [Rhodoplanes sp. Z2-YC6860]AMN43532.1 amine oxidase [Rhodoplanes sp. Z2-YC6860]